MKSEMSLVIQYDAWLSTPMRKESVSYLVVLCSIRVGVQLDVSIDVVMALSSPVARRPFPFPVHMILIPDLVRRYFLGQLPLTLALFFSLLRTCWSVISR